MPAVTSATDEENKEQKISQPMWAALKKHIIRERQRKKEEYEAEVEEERLRKEREARERQDVMTLGETREQIQQLEKKLSQLKAEKHQLFLQLKKVLNEDDNRKKQQNKDSNEMLANMGMVPGSNMVQSQLYLPPTVSQGNPNLSRPPLSSHLLNKGGGGGIKRVRSPSPPYASQGAPYMHHPHHKQQHVPHSQGPPHKMEDGRCREISSRAVLWNKAHYSSSGGGGAFYALPSQGEQRATQLLYASPLYQHVPHHTPPKQSDYGRQPSSASGPTPPSSARHNPQLIPGQVHPSVGQMQHNNTQNSKTGGITSGYPVRQQNPSVQNPSLYPNRHRY